MGRKKHPPKIFVSKKKASSKSLAGRIRKEQDKILDSLATSVVNLIRELIETKGVHLAAYTRDQVANYLGLHRDTFLELIKNGVIPSGELSPSGEMYFTQPQLKCLDIAGQRFIYLDKFGKHAVKREQMKQFLQKYWPKEDQKNGYQNDYIRAGQGNSRY